jgi:hypothetical protein
MKIVILFLVFLMQMIGTKHQRVQTVPPKWTWLQTVPSTTDGVWSMTITPHATGNTLIFCAGAGYSSQPTLANTPSAYTWTLIPTTGYYNNDIQCWKSQTTSTSAQVVTMGGSGNGFHGYAVVVEYSGLTGTLDTQATNNSAVFSPPTATGTSSAGGNLVFCFVANTSTYGAFPGFTQRNVDAYDTQYIDGTSIAGSQTITSSVSDDPWSIACGWVK